MGQQQLLLIVLGVIIVGIAIVAGIGMFNAGAEESVKDELVSHCMAIGANAQQYLKKPEAMGGGGGDWTNAAGGSYAIPPRMLATENAGTVASDGTGTADPGYVFAVVSSTAPVSATITATPDNADYKWTVIATVTENNITTEVKPNGTTTTN